MRLVVNSRLINEIVIDPHYEARSGLKNNRVKQLMS